MRKNKIIAAVLVASLMASAGCFGKGTSTVSTRTEENAVVEDGAVQDAAKKYADMTPEEICDSLSLEQKAAQMMEPTIYNTDPANMKNVDYGSILSRIDDWPMPTDEEWRSVVMDYQTNAMKSDAAIPFIYGNDSLHGVNFASGCVIFPHNINIGAANDAALTEEYGKLVGSDVAHTGMLLNFSPCVAAAQDPRWGRTYESYSSDNSIVKDMSVAYTKGLLSEGVFVCPKHFFGDGYTVFGTGENPQTMLIDRGDSKMTEEQIEEQLSVYQALIDEGVQFIMLSHSSLDGTKMHENEKYISRLKNEMGFEVVVLSDWDSILNCSGETYKDNVILAVNAGIDMFMQDTEHDECMNYIIDGVNEGLISQDRVDDAVTRIIRVKKNAGLFEDPFLENMKPSYDYNSERSHEVARELAAKSYVTLKNEGDLTLKKGMKVFVTGPAADDVGVLCGGWTNTWQGGSDKDVGAHYVEGSSILDALNEAAETVGFEVVTDKKQMDSCDVIVLCVGEIPYAEWYGDTDDISITGPLGLEDNKKAIELAADSGLPTITLIAAGRNVIIQDYIDKWDSCIMLYLPGSEGGNAAADVLTGKTKATGTLAMPYYNSMDQIGTGECWLDIGYTYN